MKVFSTCLFTFLFVSLNAQKNHLYVTTGTVLYVNAISVNYERKIEAYKHGNNQMLIKAGVGTLVFPGLFNGKFEKSIYLSLSTVFLFGKDGKYFEMDLGAATGEDAKLGGIFPVAPYVALGYRKQYKKAIFRVGASFPETAYLSLGFRF